MPLLSHLFISLFILIGLTHVPKDKKIFIPPVKIPVILSANFGELRADHFHSGIDIKTQGVIGKEIVSSADGYVYRIGVSPSGFGKALYVRHPSGYSTVYAHLDRFNPEIEAYVKSVQYERKSFAISLFPPKEKFPVNQGDLIAWSGNSGSSGGPHLHFEIRESANELPVNPLLFDIGVSDKIPPIIEKLAIYPIGKNSFVNNRNSKIIYNVTGNNGNYSLGRDLVVSGKTGFGIKIHDLLDGAGNRCGAYSISVDIDSVTIFRYVMDGFSFNESRYINAHIDYETWMKDNIRIQKTFVQPNDKLTTYKSILNKGVFDFREDKTYNVRMTVTDVHNNKSVLSFRVRSTGEKPTLMSAPSDNEGLLMPYNKPNRYSADDIEINIPSGALYDTLVFRYGKKTGNSTMLSDIHSVHNKYVPLQRAYSLAIKPTNIPAGKESKLTIIKLNDNAGNSPVNSTFTDGFVKGDVISFGDFFVGIDTIPPTISSTIGPGADLSGRKEIRIRIKDDLSGIKSYEPLIDGKWALFEYDPKNEILIYSFDEKYITKGTKHKLVLKVTDNRDNGSEYSCEFIW